MEDDIGLGRVEICRRTETTTRRKMRKTLKLATSEELKK